MINPKTALYITIVFAILGALSTGAVSWPSSVPTSFTLPLKEWATWLIGWGAILSPLIPGFSSARPGPFVAQPTAIASVKDAHERMVVEGQPINKLP